MPKVVKKKNLKGRPLKEINKKVFEQACRCFATKATICDIFECDVKTLSAWCWRTYGKGFKEAKDTFKASTKICLRQKQLSVALSGDTTMLKWLGKQELGQSDFVEVEKQAIENLEPISDMLQISNEELLAYTSKSEVVFNSKGTDHNANK